MRDALLLHGLDKIAAFAGEIPWQTYNQPGRSGVDIFPLYDTSDTGPEGPAAALVRYRPGATVSRHRHEGYELILVLEGVLKNDTGLHPAGTLEICPPGSSHALSSEEGAIFLVVWEKPVQVLPVGQMVA